MKKKKHAFNMLKDNISAACHILDDKADATTMFLCACLIIKNLKEGGAWANLHDSARKFLQEATRVNSLTLVHNLTTVLCLDEAQYKIHCLMETLTNWTAVDKRSMLKLGLNLNRIICFSDSFHYDIPDC